MGRIKSIFIFFIIVVLVVPLVGCNADCEIITDGGPSELYSNAMYLYAEGDVENATYQMALYLQMNRDDVEAMELLAGWYTELGKSSYAEKYIKMAAQYVAVQEDADIVLSGESDSALVTEHIHDATLEISPLSIRSEGTVLSVVGKNLFSGDYEKDNYLGSDAPGWRTSEWFYVDVNAKSLTISGGFNRAVWQFELQNGERVLMGDDSKTYRVSNSNLVKNLATATTAIPENAVRCRIAYAFEPDETTDTLEERIQIEYGEFPSDYEEYRFQQFSLPDLEDGSFIKYRNGQWNLSSEETNQRLQLENIDLEKGDTVSIYATLPILVKIDVQEAEVNTEGIYGVTWSNEDTSILLERTDDAVGLSFNYLSGDRWAGPYQNDFDEIYPWSEMTLCAVSDTGEITYQGEQGFATDGSAGNVFVEIPKHYVKRTVENGVEYIAISATPREGFVLDPSFQRKNGEVDHIYIGSYLLSLSSGKATSVSGEIPEICYSIDQISEYVDDLDSVSDGEYSQIDFLAVMTLQRLFLIETGVRNSQVFWVGEATRTYFSYLATYQCALNTDKDSNVIIIENNSMNRRFQIGDAVCVCTFEQFQGEKQYDNYYSRIITDIQLVNNQLQITFDGEPQNIVAGETRIAHVSDVNGKTDGLFYHSGSNGLNDGLSAFRYRYLENLWGNGMTKVKGVEVTGTTIHVTYPDGRTSILSYNLAIQSQAPIGNNTPEYAVMNVGSLGYDEANPLIMLPDTVGRSCSLSFGDTLYTGYHDGWEDKTVTLLWGGTWDIRNSAGMFCYRFLASRNDTYRENVSRLMCWLPMQ